MTDSVIFPVNVFLKIAAICCVMLVLNSVARANVCFLPSGDNYCDTVISTPVVNVTPGKLECAGYSSIKKDGYGWTCSECGLSTGGVMYKCDKVPCPSGYTTNIVCDTRGFDQETKRVRVKSGRPGAEYVMAIAKSGDDICYKCVAKSCPTGETTNQCGDGYTAVNTDNYAGNSRCHRCDVAPCVEGGTDVTCRSGETKQSTGYSSGSKVCYKCVCTNETCPVGRLNACNTNTEIQTQIVESTCGNKCYLCQAKPCPDKQTTNPCALGYTAVDTNNYSGTVRCHRCEVADCPTGETTSQCGAGYTPVDTNNHSGLARCHRCDVVACVEGSTSVSCLAGETPQTTGYYSGSSPCYKCVCTNETCPYGGRLNACNTSTEIQVLTTTSTCGNTCHVCASLCPSYFSSTTQANSHCYNNDPCSDPRGTFYRITTKSPADSGYTIYNNACCKYNTCNGSFDLTTQPSSSSSTYETCDEGCGKSTTYRCKENYTYNSSSNTCNLTRTYTVTANRHRTFYGRINVTARDTTSGDTTPNSQRKVRATISWYELDVEDGTQCNETWLSQNCGDKYDPRVCSDEMHSNFGKIPASQTVTITINAGKSSVTGTIQGTHNCVYNISVGGITPVF